MKRRGSLLTGSIAGSMCPAPTKNSKLEVEKAKSDETPSDTEAALLYLKTLFPAEKFDPRLPAIAMKHQVYSIVHDRTIADRELMTLRDSGRIRLFKLGVSNDEFAVLFTEDYVQHIKSYLGDTPLYRRFVGVVLHACKDVSITKKQLAEELRVGEEDTTTLVNRGVLLVRDVGKACSWWFAIPAVSTFTRSYTKGRAMVQQMIKRSKYKEILQRDLESRRLTVSQLGMEYHIHDIIGAELVECMRTTSGPLLRLNEDTGKQRRR